MCNIDVSWVFGKVRFILLSLYLSPVAIHPFFNPSLCVCLCPLFFFSSLFNQCPTPFASVCLTCHHMGKGIKDLLWIKSQPCTVVWQSSKTLNIVSIIMLTTVCLVRGRVSEEPVIQCSYSYTGMHINILYAWHYVSVNVFQLHCNIFQLYCTRLRELWDTVFVQRDVFVKPHGRLSSWKDCSCSTRDRQEGQSSGDIYLRSTAL